MAVCDTTYYCEMI